MVLIDWIAELELSRLALYALDTFESAIELQSLVNDSDFVNACIDDRICWARWIEIRYIEAKLNNDPWFIIMKFLYKCTEDCYESIVQDIIVRAIKG